MRLFTSNNNYNYSSVYKHKLFKSGRIICLWNDSVRSSCELRRSLEQILGGNYASILRVRQVVDAKSGMVRWDIFVIDTKHLVCLDLLQKASQRNGWFVRLHIPFIEREMKRRINGISKHDSRLINHIKMLSLNVNGLIKKKSEVVLMAQQLRTDILLLQETLYPEGSLWALKIPGFTVLSCAKTNGVAGLRGIALAVRRDLVTLDLGYNSGNALFVRTFAGGKMLIIGTVYVPSGKEKKLALESILGDIHSIMIRFPHIPLVIGGDWNLTQEKFKKYIQRKGLPLECVTFSGSNLTFNRGVRRSAIDYFVVSETHKSMVKKARVERTWDISDHWPVMLNIILDGAELNTPNIQNEVAPLGRLNRKKVRLESERILGNNKFACLLDTIVEHENNQEDVSVEMMDRDIKSFMDVSVAVSNEYNLFDKRVNRPKPQYLSRKTCRAIDARRIKSMELQAAGYRYLDYSPEIGKFKEAYEKAADKVKKLIKKEKLDSWTRFVKRGMDLIDKNEYRSFWKWLKILRGDQSRLSIFAPVCNKDGVLCTTPDDIKRAWGEHYASLCGDDDGISKDNGMWSERLVGSPKLELPNINVPVTWQEVNNVLATIKNFKAPGISGMPGEWIKICWEKEPGNSPDTYMGKVLFSICKRMIESAAVPASINRATIVSIPKKGDLTVMDNYRGISLMEVLLKLSCNVVIRRISTAIESGKLLIPEQAGFRPHHECAGQIICLYEICRRREIMDMPTFLAFLDFKKAYDSVPHEALLAKLKHFGVRGMAFEFIEAVYANSKVAVRTQSGLTAEVPFLRGSRQGCPMSPTLFDIFINDLFDECRELGVEVPGVGRIPGLLYADDAVLTASSRGNLRRMLDAVSRWAVKWGMNFGISKCAVMVIHGDMERLRNRPLLLQGNPLSVVEEYTYLGISFNYKLDLDKIIADRVVSTKKALGSLMRVLYGASIPMLAKVKLINGVLLPISTYGGELFGMSENRVQPIQVVVNKAIRLVSGTSLTACSAGVIRKELKITSVFARTSAARARCFIKLPTMPTWAGIITSSAFTGRKRTWLTATKVWLKSTGDDGIRAWVNHLVPKTYSILVRDYCETRLFFSDLKSTVSAAKYNSLGLVQTNDYIKVAACDVNLSLGLRELLRIRTNALLTGKRLACAGLIDSKYKKYCPCCGRRKAETIRHYLLRCKEWSNERQEMLSVVPNSVFVTLSNSHADALFEFLLGSLLLGEGVGVDYYPLWLMGNGNDINGVNVPVWRAVALYLQSTRIRRYKLIWRSSVTTNQRPHGYGMF